MSEGGARSGVLGRRRDDHHLGGTGGFGSVRRGVAVHRGDQRAHPESGGDDDGTGSDHSDQGAAAVRGQPAKCSGGHDEPTPVAQSVVHRVQLHQHAIADRARCNVLPHPVRPRRCGVTVDEGGQQGPGLQTVVGHHRYPDAPTKVRAAQGPTCPIRQRRGRRSGDVLCGGDIGGSGSVDLCRPQHVAEAIAHVEIGVGRRSTHGVRVVGVGAVEVVVGHRCGPTGVLACVHVGHRVPDRAQQVRLRLVAWTAAVANRSKGVAEHLAHDVVGFVLVASETTGEAEDGVVVPFVQRTEGLRVSVPDCVEQTELAHLDLVEPRRRRPLDGCRPGDPPGSVLHGTTVRTSKCHVKWPDHHHMKSYRTVPSAVRCRAGRTASGPAGSSNRCGVRRGRTRSRTALRRTCPTARHCRGDPPRPRRRRCRRPPRGSRG